MRRFLVMSTMLAAVPALAACSSDRGEQVSDTSPPPAYNNPTPMAATQPSARFDMSRDDIRQVQQTLNHRGFDAGHVDGVWGPQTQTALMNFQRNQGLQATGNLNQDTLTRLDLSNIMQTDNGNGGSANNMNSNNMNSSNMNAPATSPNMSSPTTVREVQQALNDRGYDPGPIDGQWDSQTQSAVHQFQQAKGMQATGQIDQQLLAALQVNPNENGMNPGSSMNNTSSQPPAAEMNGHSTSQTQ